MSPFSVSLFIIQPISLKRLHTSCDKATKILGMSPTCNSTVGPAFYIWFYCCFFYTRIHNLFGYFIEFVLIKVKSKRLDHKHPVVRPKSSPRGMQGLSNKMVSYFRYLRQMNILVIRYLLYIHFK